MVKMEALSTRDEERYLRSLRWFLFFRVLILVLFFGGTSLHQMRGGTAQTNHALFYISILVGIYCLEAILSIILLPRISRRKFFVHIQIVWDLLFVTFLIYLTGGIQSFFSFLYIFIVLSAVIFLSRKESIFVASAAAILYGSLLDLQFYNYLPGIPGVVHPQIFDSRDMFYAVFIHVIAFYLTALLGGTLGDRLRKSEEALERKEIDYDELENLNRTILANINSGLMIVNASGRIRSFNPAAAHITGYSLEEVYNQDAREIFPDIELFNDDQFAIISRGEMDYLDRSGNPRTLGYATSLVHDSQPDITGLLVTFQDLTTFKRMEEELKRADRLAAVGRLASGMAHEIRNPLASISGSVQLLMESGSVHEEDRQLMEIVVKEAGRLNGLLSDFLIFARPGPPIPERVNVAEFLEEVADMIRRDLRFDKIDVQWEYPEEIFLHLDRRQLSQVLWNLLINAAEAMSGLGRLKVGVIPAESAIYVEDSGPGIAEDIRSKIFDPFFTTKEKGTGLGLTTIYAIVEAHKGKIEVSSGQKGGARFTIRFPEG